MYKKKEIKKEALWSSMERTEDYGICLWRTFMVLRLFLLGNKPVIKASCEFSIDNSGDQSNLFFGLKHCGANLTCCLLACDTFNQIQFSKQNYSIFFATMKQ